jgi:hypothetical protein
MTTPYAALLSVRQVEEQRAEVALADALRTVTALDRQRARVHGARVAWLVDGAAEGLDAVLSETLADLEGAEREAEARLAEAQQRAGSAREALLERRRAREVVEKLHLETLAAAARASARRLQQQLDEFGGRTAAAVSQGAR